MLGGKKTILTSSSDLSSSKFGGWPEELSSKQRAFRGRLFSLQNCNTLWQKCLAYHSEKICCVTQAFLFEVQMTGIQDFGMPFNTLGIPDTFPPRSKVSQSLDVLKPGANSSSFAI